MPGRRSRLARDALHQVAVAAQDIDSVLEQLEARPVVAGRQPLGRHRHADAGADALPQRPRRCFNARRLAKFGMAGTGAMELPKILDVLERDRQALFQAIVVLGHLAHAREMQNGVQQHRGMAARENEAVARRPHRLRGIIAQVVLPKLIGHRRQGHRRSGVAALGLFHCVHAQRADRVDGQKFNAGLGFGDGHEANTRESDSSECKPVSLAVRRGRGLGAGNRAGAGA